MGQSLSKKLHVSVSVQFQKISTPPPPPPPPYIYTHMHTHKHRLGTWKGLLESLTQTQGIGISGGWGFSKNKAFKEITQTSVINMLLILNLKVSSYLNSVASEDEWLTTRDRIRWRLPTLQEIRSAKKCIKKYTSEDVCRNIRNVK